MNPELWRRSSPSLKQLLWVRPLALEEELAQHGENAGQEKVGKRTYKNTRKK